MIPDWVPENRRPTIPPLKRLSDWLFVVWQNVCGNNKQCIKTLGWVIHVGVTDDSSKNAAKVACGFNGDSWPAYPGYRFDIPDEDAPPNEWDQRKRDGFNALTGCPNGYGTAFLLQQHREYFPRFVISQIDVFGEESFGMLCLLYKMGPPEYD